MTKDLRALAQNIADSFLSNIDYLSIAEDWDVEEAGLTDDEMDQVYSLIQMSTAVLPDEAP